jgi:hypothetical protein
MYKQSIDSCVSTATSMTFDTLLQALLPVGYLPPSLLPPAASAAGVFPTFSIPALIWQLVRKSIDNIRIMVQVERFKYQGIVVRKRWAGALRSRFPQLDELEVLTAEWEVFEWSFWVRELDKKLWFRCLFP